MEKKNRQIILNIVGIAILVVGLVGLTYAFFNYTRTGSENVLAVGRVYFNSSQGTSINLTNVFPVKSTELENNPNVGSVVLTITGDTTYDDGLEYLISADQVVNTINSKKIPVGIKVTVNNIGSSDDDYFTNRGGNSSIYKLLAKDTIKEDEKLVVGYITKGATGVNGSVTVKAFIDSDKIAITDTPDENSEWQQERTVFSTAEWNSFNSTGVSFKLKVEANEGLWVEEPLTIYGAVQSNADTVTQINFANKSSDSNGKGIYILPGTEDDTNPIYYYRGEVTNNNVIFGGYCWQIVRTTDTGGVKMIYNGVVTDDGTTCTNSTYDTRILSNTSSFYSMAYTISDIAYMSNAEFEMGSSSAASGSIYGKKIEWNGNNYLVIEDTAGSPSTNETKDNNHHYTCGTSGTTSCSSVRYYYYNNYYITLSNGDLLEDALYKMTGSGSQATKTKNASFNINANNSVIKTALDDWFRTNLTSEVDENNPNYSAYLEDSVYCSDRSFKTTGANTYAQGGWNPNGGVLSSELFFGTHNRYNNSWYSQTNVPTVKNIGSVPNIACPNESDRFTVSARNGNGSLTYPVGLLTADEIILAGASGNSDSSENTYYLNIGGSYWSMSPSFLYHTGVTSVFNVKDSGSLGSERIHTAQGVRPVVSLKSGTEFVTGGDGSPTNPYVVKYND